MNEERRRIAQKYIDGIKNPDIILPFVPDYAKPVWHIFAVRTDKRDELAKYLEEKEFSTNKHYPIAIHLQECYRDLNIKKGDLPIAEKISETQLSLPLYYGMTDEQIDFVIECINNFK